MAMKWRHLHLTVRALDVQTRILQRNPLLQRAPARLQRLNHHSQEQWDART